MEYSLSCLREAADLDLWTVSHHVSHKTLYSGVFSLCSEVERIHCSLGSNEKG